MWLAGVLLCINFEFITSQGLVGKGLWAVNSITKCENYDKYPVDMEFRRRKVNRTHDGFSVDAIIPELVTENNYGIHIEVCKYVDGGCKLIVIFSDRSACRFLFYHVKENIENILIAAGREAKCPISKGEFAIRNYVFNYEQLPEEGMLGQFRAVAYFTKGPFRVACVTVDLTFVEGGRDRVDDDE